MSMNKVERKYRKGKSGCCEKPIYVLRVHPVYYGSKYECEGCKRFLDPRFISFLDKIIARIYSWNDRRKRHKKQLKRYKEKQKQYK